MQFSPIQVTLLLWTLLVAGQTSTSVNWTWTKTLSLSSASVCTSCAVAAEEFYLSYPYSVSTISTPVTLTVVPYVTVHTDGSRETNLETEARGPNGQTTISGPVGTNSPKLTWEPFVGVTLTYPTTYVNFPFPYGGLDVPSNGACVTNTAPLTLPTNSAQGLIYPVTISNWNTKQPWNVTQQMLDYLDSIPAVSKQFNGTKVGKCVWETYVTPAPATTLPTQKVTVQYLTAVTAQEQVIVRPNTQSPTPTSSSLALPTAFTRNIPQATATTTPPIVVVNSSATHLSSSLAICIYIISILYGSLSVLLGG